MSDHRGLRDPVLEVVARTVLGEVGGDIAEVTTLPAETDPAWKDPDWPYRWHEATPRTEVRLDVGGYAFCVTGPTAELEECTRQAAGHILQAMVNQLERDRRGRGSSS